MGKYAAEKIAQEYYNLGVELSFYKVANVSKLHRLLFGDGGHNLMTGIVLGQTGVIEPYVLGKIVNNANKDLSNLTAKLKSRK
jgi:hypothetical protein